MGHPVICSICGKRFDRDKVQAVRTGARRYAHATCDKENKDFVPLAENKEDADLTKLKDFINQLYGKEANWAQINRQIKIYTTENNYSYSGILKSLVYFYQVKNNSIDKSNGAIGIVPFVYQDAYNYYYSLFLAQNQNEKKDIKSLVTKVKEVTIPLPKINLPKKLFKFLDNDEEVSDDE